MERIKLKQLQKIKSNGKLTIKKHIDLKCQAKKYKNPSKSKNLA